MELFVPSLIVILIAAIFAFFVIPKMGSMILAITSLVALIAAGIHHYSLFYSEYQLSTWQNGIGANAPFFVLGIAFLFIISAIYYMFTGSASTVTNALSAPITAITETVETAVNSMPSANTATNPITSAINTGLNAVLPTMADNTKKNNTSFFGATTSNKKNNTSFFGASNKKNNSPLLPGLGFKASEA
jgi:hypothetical protein